MFDGYLWEGEVFCEIHAADDMDPMFDPYVDSPWHCAECGRMISQQLTSEGEEYVREHLREDLLAPLERNHTWGEKGAEGSLSYYVGSPGWIVLREWTDLLPSSDPLADGYRHVREFPRTSPTWHEDLSDYAYQCMEQGRREDAHALLVARSITNPIPRKEN